MLLTKFTVGRWTSKITGQVKLSNVHCSGQPTTFTQALLQHAHEVIRNDPQITTRKLATELSVFKCSLNNVSNALIYSKVCAHWLSQSLTKYHKTVQKEVHSESSGKILLSWIITVDENGSSTFNDRQKIASGMALSNFSLEGEV